MQLFDLHQDVLLGVNRKELLPGPLQTSFELNEQAGVSALFSSAFPAPIDFNHFDESVNDLIEADIDAYIAHTQHSGWEIACGPESYARIADPDTRSLILHVEGLNVFEGGPEDWGRLERWYKKGWRSCGFVWNKENSLGGGTESESTGLTDLGNEVLTWCEERNMVVDCAHMNDQTFNDIADRTTRPLFVSHANARVLCDSPRNLNDEQLKRVADSGGLVGVFCSAKFLHASGTATASVVADHIDHMRDVMGIDHVGIGTDFGGILSATPSDMSSIEEIDVLWDELRKRGYSEEDIEKVAHKNAERVAGVLLGYI